MEPTTPAERALLDAAQSGEECDLRNPQEARANLAWAPSAEDAAVGGEVRQVRADYLRHLLLGRQLPVHLIGARIDGDLDVSGGHALTLSLPRCVLTGSARFDGATFTGTASFGGATFTRSARFDGATFTGTASFAGATFTGSTWSDSATFGSATFTGDALFVNATFIAPAWFDMATFTGSARFDSATFTSPVWFGRAMFTETAWFVGAAFTGSASFDEAMFTGTASFDGATFTGTARFIGARFSGDACFRGSRWCMLDWSRTVWETAAVESAGLAAVDIVLDRALFEQPVRLELTAGRVTMKRARAVERLHLVVAGAKVTLEDADLADGSLIDAAPVQIPTTALEADAKDGQEQQVQDSGIGRWVVIPPFMYTTLDPEQRHARSLMYAMLFLKADLSTALNHTPQASVTSLRRAHVAGTTLSGMDLRACTFTGADGLDELVITGDDILTNHRGDKDMTRAWPAYGRRWWRTSRRVLHDELALRDPPATTEDTDETTTTTGEPATTPTAPLTYRSVSATYRSLRKALEDSKDEPGAADFYYGEMDMRRLAAKPMSVERWLLSLYWLVAGYGLRAWRALASLALVIAVAGWCFTNDAWAKTTDVKQPGAVNLDTGNILYQNDGSEPLTTSKAFLFAMQETVALFRPAGLSGITLTGVGHVVDIAVRILGPVLLALAVLAIRNRTKR